MAKATSPKGAAKGGAKTTAKARKLDVTGTVDQDVDLKLGARRHVPSPEDDVQTGLRVRAVKMVFYGNKRRRPGDVFDLAHESHFSQRGSMEWVNEKTPTRTTKSEEALKAEQQEIRSAVLKNKGTDEVI